MIYDVIIIGGGPAGLEAALNLVENNIENILILEFEEYLGGALQDIIEVDSNFGDNGTTGVELAQNLINQINSKNIKYRVGTQVISVSKDLEVEALTKEEGLLYFKGKAIIFATGSRERPRGILNFTQNRSTGIFSVGTARRFVVREGYLPGKKVVIYGGDFTGIYLSKLLMIEGAQEVTIIDQFRELKFPSDDLKEEIEKLGVNIILGYSIKAIEGNNRVEGIKVVSNSDNTSLSIECDTLLLSVGLSPKKNLSKKFRRDPENSGVFLIGNANSITFNMNKLKEDVYNTNKRVISYLNGK